MAWENGMMIWNTEPNTWRVTSMETNWVKICAAHGSWLIIDVCMCGRVENLKPVKTSNKIPVISTHKLCDFT